ncbi:GNAT family N-acetyltransferase [Sphingobacterium psychroaquaticum]|uniref:GNAT family N-acetyltransferase n=1 Tax=Sphingobacterium psychroaquaticum TaxID=561061 RepID=UPI001F0FFC97|nr:GNAT family N-acetyltransferase [Sphingobacterium psychroaquaticum]
MEQITIKKVSLSDINQLQKIGKETFFETFSESNTEENMANYLTEGFSFEKLTDELNNSTSMFYFALSQNEVIGYLKINFGQSQTELKDEKALEIERIYVLKEYHGKNVGQVLYQKAMEIAKEKKQTMFG